MSDELRPRSRYGCRELACACVLSAVACLVVSAAEPAIHGTRDGVIVLTNGRLVTGRIQESPAGYVVEKPTGSLLVPYEQVRLAASDAQAAYRKMRQEMTRPSAADHTALARWCITYRLYSEAREELRDALNQDPAYREARNTLVRLDAVLADDQGPPAEPTIEDESHPPPASSLAGLSRESAETFVSKIQPLLINTCGNAGCHSQSDENDFCLIHVRLGSGGHRIHAERNLATVLAQVDLARPGTSPLLVTPRGNHGRGGEPVFRGPHGTEQSELLERWVRDVARERAAGVDRTAELSFFAPPDNEPQAEILIRPQSVSEPQKSGAPPDGGDVLETVLEEERADAFDPREFNRLMHGMR